MPTKLSTKDIYRFIDSSSMRDELYAVHYEDRSLDPLNPKKVKVTDFTVKSHPELYHYARITACLLFKLISTNISEEFSTHRLKEKLQKHDKFYRREFAKQCPESMYDEAMAKSVMFYFEINISLGKLFKAEVCKDFNSFSDAKQLDRLLEKKPAPRIARAKI